MRGLVRVGFTLMLLLTGCALRDLTPAPQVASERVPFELTPISEIQVVGSCDDSPLLERWLQTVFRQRDAFNAARESALNNNDNESLTVMADIRFGLSRVDVPDCAEQAHSFLIEAMTESLIAIEEFFAGEVEDIDVALSDADGLFAQFDDVYETLSERLAQQLGGDTTGS